MSVHSSIKLSALSLFAASVVTLASLALSGCATGIIASSSATADSAMAIQGTVHGGSAVISGANIILWETDPTNSGYPSASNEKSKILAGSLAGAITTSSTGGFSLSSATTCDTGTYLYITATGGTVNGNGAVNNNLVLASALGSCKGTSLPTNLHIAINEATTIAVAYGLGNFLYVDDTTPGFQGVYIGAPANNAAATGACTGAGSAMKCVAAGLAHAFQNATNLVQSNANGVEPTGFPNATVPGNSLGYIPVAQVNLLANIMQHCTNSTGGSGTGGAAGASDGTACGNYFSNSKSVTCSTTTCVPQDTLTAAVSIAQNPQHNIANLYSYATGVANAFVPSLGATPKDLSIPITYTGSSSNFGAVQYLALDANDDVYAVAGDLQVPTQSAVFAMQSNGTPIWNTSYKTTYCAPTFLATDTVGNVWAVNNATSTGCGGAGPAIVGLSQATGAITQNFTYSGASSPINGISQPYGIAVDQNNNLWFDSSNSGTSAAVYEIPYSGGAATGGTYSTAVVEANNLGNLSDIQLDGSQNVWFSTIGTSATTTPQALYVVPNTGTAAAPSYPGSAGTNPVYTFAPNSGGGYSFGFALDASGDAWAGLSTGSSANTSEIVPTKTSGVITALSTVGTSFGSETKVYESEFDGGGQLWYAYNNTNGEPYFVYNPLGTSAGGSTAQSNKGFVPCFITVASSTTCSSTVALYYDRTLQIDSAGAVWIGSLGSATTGTGNGTIVQILGAGKPTWPQLSYAHFAVEPQ